MQQLELVENNIKLAFIDFDDTAIVHLDHGVWRDFTESRLKGTGDMYRLGKRTAPLPGMSNLLKQLKELKIPVFCLTVVDDSLIIKCKADVLDKAYGPGMFKDVIGVSSREGKMKFIKELRGEFLAAPCQVLIVDDHPDTVYEAIRKGMLTATPQEIVCRYAMY